MITVMNVHRHIIANDLGFTAETSGAARRVNDRAPLEPGSPGTRGLRAILCDCF